MSKRRFRIRTWHLENAFVAASLSSVLLATGGGANEIVGSVAVFCGFCHASIAERLREREAARSNASVECHRLQIVFFVAKELLWILYFVRLHAFSALVGCGVFLAYPAWCALWRRIYPLARCAMCDDVSSEPLDAGWRWTTQHDGEPAWECRDCYEDEIKASRVVGP